MQYVYATRNTLIFGMQDFVAQTFVCATDIYLSCCILNVSKISGVWAYNPEIVDNLDF